MTIALTGATGFVGRQILRQLLEGGHSVRVVVRERAKLGEVAAAKNLEIVTCGDIFDQPTELTVSLLQGCETLVHAAWYAEPGKYLHSTENIQCLKGTLDLFQAFTDSGGRRFVGIGSCAEYDLISGPVSPNSPLSPQSLYAACKVAAFQVLMQLASKQNTSFAWCRIFHLYGEGENDRRIVAYLHKQLSAKKEALLSSGNQIRDFLNVKDAANLICIAALSEHEGPVNICSGKGITVRELAEGIADQYGARNLLKFGSIPDNLLEPKQIIGIR